MANSRKRPPSDLAERVLRELERHVQPQARVTLALSGGVDSIVLLDLLARVAPRHPFALECLHVNHRISPNAPAWARFAREAAKRYGLRCWVKRVDLARYRSLGLEGAARAARYEVFARAQADFIALAQHQDDQAETVLLQLVRGAGVTGLAAMPAVRSQPKGGPQLLRPLIGATRAEITAYARATGLEWIEDESNDDERLARNFVRRRVVPLLHELNPQACANLARSAAHLAEASELAQALGALDVRGAARDGRLSVAALSELPRARAKNALRWHLASAGLGAPTSAHTEEMLDQILNARDDAAIRFVFEGGEVRRFRGLVWIVPRRDGLRRDFRARWTGERTWHLPELGGVMRFVPTRGGGLSRRTLAGKTVEVRVRKGGERIRPNLGRPSRPLKSLLQEAAIPPWERERLPLLYCGRRLAFVPGIGVEASLAAKPGEAGVAISWQPLAVGTVLNRGAERGQC